MGILNRRGEILPTSKELKDYTCRREEIGILHSLCEHTTKLWGKKRRIPPEGSPYRNRELSKLGLRGKMIP